MAPKRDLTANQVMPQTKNAAVQSATLSSVRPFEALDCIGGQQPIS